MRRTCFRFFLFFFLGVSLVPLVKVQAAEKNCSYNVGVVPQFDERRIFNTWTPLLEMLSKKAECRFTLAPVKTIDEFETKLKAGEFDFAYANPLQVLKANKNQGYEPLVHAGSELGGIIVVKKDDPIKDVSELNGKDMVIPSPYAFGASIVTAYELKQDYNTVVNLVDVKTHSSVYLHVAKGLAKAGGGILETFKNEPESVQSSLRILHETHKYSPHGFIAHGRVNADVKKLVAQEFLDIWAKEPKLLENVPMKKPVQASIEDYKNLERFLE